MPLYEYQCQECGETQEVVQRFSDPPFTICPLCGGGMKKLISAPAIQFKGSGFYITDYGKGNDATSKSKDGAPKSDSKSDSKSESKSEKKSETQSESTSSGSSGREGTSTTGTKA